MTFMEALFWLTLLQSRQLHCQESLLWKYYSFFFFLFFLLRLCLYCISNDESDTGAVNLCFYGSYYLGARKRRSLAKRGEENEDTDSLRERRAVIQLGSSSQVTLRHLDETCRPLFFSFFFFPPVLAWPYVPMNSTESKRCLLGD